MKRLIPAATLLFFGCGLPALADEMQPKRPIYGCVDPRATTALAIPDGRLRNRKWVDYVHRTGHCFALTPDQRLQTLTTQGSLILVKLSDGTDTPPIYVQSADVSRAPDQAPPTPPSTASIPQTDAASPAPVPTPSMPATSTPTLPAPAAPQPSTDSPAATSSRPQAPALPEPGTAEPPSPATVGPVPSPAPAPATTMAAPNASPATLPATPSNQIIVPIRSADARSSGISVLLVVLVILALLALVGIAIAVARQQRRFAHVEDGNWPPRDDRINPSYVPAPSARTQVRPAPSPQAFRASCLALLEQGGWVIQPSFAASGSPAAANEGVPDIMGRRNNAILAVRCRTVETPITMEMIDEAAAMGKRQGAHVTVLATDQSVTQRAHDEAMRLHVHVLRGDELNTLSA